MLALNTKRRVSPELIVAGRTKLAMAIIVQGSAAVATAVDLLRYAGIGMGSALHDIEDNRVWSHSNDAMFLFVLRAVVQFSSRHNSFASVIELETRNTARTDRYVRAVGTSIVVVKRDFLPLLKRPPRDRDWWGFIVHKRTVRCYGWRRHGLGVRVSERERADCDRLAGCDRAVEGQVTRSYASRALKADGRASVVSETEVRR